MDTEDEGAVFLVFVCGTLYTCSDGVVQDTIWHCEVWRAVCACTVTPAVRHTTHIPDVAILVLNAQLEGSLCRWVRWLRMVLWSQLLRDDKSAPTLPTAAQSRSCTALVHCQVIDVSGTGWRFRTFSCVVAKLTESTEWLGLHFHGQSRMPVENHVNAGEVPVFAFYFGNQVKQELAWNTRCTKVSVCTNMGVCCCIVEIVDHHLVQPECTVVEKPRSMSCAPLEVPSTSSPRRIL